MWGLGANTLAHGRSAEALQSTQEVLNVAAATGDTDLLMTGHMAACVCNYWVGEFIRSVEHADKVLMLYDAERHRHLADILNQDPKTFVGTWGAASTWILGFPARALRLEAEKDAHARQRGHPFDLGYALVMGAGMLGSLFDSEDLRKRAEEVERLGRENSLPVLWAVLAPRLYGLALIRDGRPAEAIALLEANLTAWEATGGKANGPTYRAFLAEAMALTGELDGALLLLDEAITQIERPGWEERYFYAEVLRLKGWVLSLKGTHEGAERNFLTSLTWARRQQAKSWELRTAMSLARLWQSQGKRQDAYALLAPVYDWFTEGFDTRDLQEAKSLLAELR
jgi:predicted ATPase